MGITDANVAQHYPALKLEPVNVDKFQAGIVYLGGLTGGKRRFKGPANWPQ